MSAPRGGNNATGKNRRLEKQQRQSSTRKADTKSQFERLYEEAEALQQKAERSKGKQALDKFDKSRAKYLEALGVEGTPTQMSDCYCLLAEVEQSMAQELLRSMNEDACGVRVEDALHDDAVQHENAVIQQASSLFHAAIEHYKSSAENVASMRVDCLNNCANTMAEYGDAVMYVSPDMAQQLFVESRMLYEAALQKEEDSGTWSNIADMLVSHAGCDTSNAQGLYEQGMEAYHRSCELCSSGSGDNLPSLLTDWGSGLLQYAEWLSEKAGRMSDSQIVLEEAAKRLCHAVSFDRGSTAPHIALGDVYIAMAENFMKAGDAERALELTQRAMGEGHEMALKIQRNCVDALIGCAEALALQSKILRMSTSDHEWQPVMEMAVSMYQKAVESGTLSGTVGEKSNLWYNIACCLVGLDRLDEGMHIIQVLIRAGTTTVEDVLSDEDLQPLHTMCSVLKT